MAAASALLLLLLLLVTPPSSSAAAFPGMGKYFAQAVRSIIKKTAKDYIKDKMKDGARDFANPSNNKDARQLGSSAADSYGALSFELSVGTPPQSLYVVMDITSELIWARCDPCTTCDMQTPPGTTPPCCPSATFEQIQCNNKICPSSISDNCDSGADQCRYKEVFFLSGYTSGYLANEKFSFGTTAFPDKVVFGCSDDFFLPGLEDASGFAGFSRGPLSLVSQLKISQFSYLIAPPDDSGNSNSSLSWSWDDPTHAAPGSRSTPLLKPTDNQNPYWYYVNLTGVKVDGQLLTAIPAETFDVEEGGSGGVFLTTTLPVTYLEQVAYNVLRNELVSRLKEQGVDPVNADDDLNHLCFSTETFGSAKVNVPKLALVFDGSDATMELSVENYFFKLADEQQTCLTILPSTGGSVLGSLLQMDTNMTYHIYADGTGLLTFEKAAAVGASHTAAGAPSAKAHLPVVIIVATLLAAWGLTIQSLI